MGIAITKTTNAIKVDFGATPFQESVNSDSFDKGTWRIDHMSDVKLEANDNFVLVTEEDGHNWRLSYDGYDGTFTVDTVDAVAPTSNDDLYNKLSALIE